MLIKSNVLPLGHVITTPCQYQTNIDQCNIHHWPLLCLSTYLDLDLVPRILIRTLGDELSPSGTVVGSISRVIRINTQCVQILLRCVLPCPLWSSDPPPATFWSPHYG